MSGAEVSPDETGPVAARSYRRAHRPADGRIVGGVAAGLAEHLSLPVFWVRAAFVLATFFNGVGIIAYAGMWRFLPLRDPASQAAPGIASATRMGMRTSPRLTKHDTAQAAALLALGAGVILAQQQVGWGISPRLLLPVLIAMVGVVLLWRLADESQRRQWSESGSPLLGIFLGSGGASALARLLLGVALVATAIGLFVAEQVGLSALRDVAGATALALAGVALLVGPWVYKLTVDLADERRERVRTQARADMAAHLHDSVLQTLALLQRNADDPRTVARLARQQERDLRDWLYGGDEQAGASLCADLTTIATEVETAHDVVVEVVCVGDVASATPLVQAAREAMTNAAKHSGVDRVDVYAEVGPESVQVFVRDRGIGFDPDRIATVRMGVRESILARMQRHGGRAEVRSAPGDGTEVMLRMPVMREDGVNDQT